MLEEVADPTYSGTVQVLGGGRSDKLTLSPLFSLLQLGQTADLSGDSPIIGPALIEVTDESLLYNQGFIPISGCCASVRIRDLFTNSRSD